MNLKQLLVGLDYELINGTLDKEISGISWDSRKTTEGHLFICVKNKNVDRHEFASDAVKMGAIAVISEHDIELPASITHIRIKDTRKVMAIISDRYFGHPSGKLNLIGVTGTNGKTSVTTFISAILEYAGRKPGIIGTIENKIGDKQLKTEKINPTTPDSMELQASLNEMLENGSTDVAMEVTSIAMDYNRVDCCDFDIGIFTNLSQDHLDEHGSMENYRTAKLKLFESCKNAAINVDDENMEYFFYKAKENCNRVITYGVQREADIKANNIEFSFDGTSFVIEYEGREYKTFMRVPGLFSVYNALAAASACILSGLDMELISEAISHIKGVRGRFETVSNSKGFSVVVDYAHTPQALESIIKSVRCIAQRRVIVVFGCGGDRDKKKRVIMGEVAGKLSDYCLITSDNPRNEEPKKIIDDIYEGVRKTGCDFGIVQSRKAAINIALSRARAGDVVIIAGKGHETSQVFRNHAIYFDDVEAVKEYFNGRQ